MSDVPEKPKVEFAVGVRRPASSLDKSLDMGDGFFINSISGPWPVLCPPCGGEGDRVIPMYSTPPKGFRVQHLPPENVYSRFVKRIICSACDGKGTKIV